MTLKHFPIHFDSVSNTVKNFYNNHPFPGFDLTKYNMRDDLFRYATDYAKSLYMNIPYGKRIADIGCGTGQFACMMSLRASYVVGVDFSSSSVAKANALKERLGLKNIDFFISDIENMKNIGGKFDYIFCSGVLHHLKDPYREFSKISELLAEGGYIIIGIYNKYGRIALKIKRALIGSKNRDRAKIKAKIQKEHFTGKEADIEKKTSWYLDQYLHPYENSFTIEEAISWFKRNNISYINSIPSIESFAGMKSAMRPFEKKDNSFLASSSKSLFIQLSWIWKLRNNGGYFILIGRR